MPFYLMSYLEYPFMDYPSSKVLGCQSVCLFRSLIPPRRLNGLGQNFVEKFPLVWGRSLAKMDTTATKPEISILTIAVIIPLYHSFKTLVCRSVNLIVSSLKTPEMGEPLELKFWGKIHLALHCRCIFVSGQRKV